MKERWLLSHGLRRGLKDDAPTELGPRWCEKVRVCAGAREAGAQVGIE